MPKRWEIASPTALLVILALINFLNYVDRMVVAPLVPFLKDEKTGLGLTSGQVGALGWAFMIVHSLASIPLGYLADRTLRRRLIATGVAVWSLATSGAALARSFIQIFFARAAVGIGEATYAPAASALISERFSQAMRARVLGIFQLGMVLGGAVGIIIGGLVAPRWGWRAAFLVVGMPGLVLAALALLLHENPPEPRRKQAAETVRTDDPGSWSAAAWIAGAGILITFFTGAIVFWAPDFILRTQFGNDKSFMDRVTTSFGPIAVAAGVAGVLAGSVVADRMERLRPGAGRLVTISLGAFASAPCAAIAFLAPAGWLTYLMLGLGVFFNVWYVGPILAALHDVVPHHRRATATGAYFFLIHFFGDAISPLIVGWLDDRTGSLRTGLLGSAGVLALGGLAVLFALPGSRRVAQTRRDKLSSA